MHAGGVRAGWPVDGVAAPDHLAWLAVPLDQQLFALFGGAAGRAHDDPDGLLPVRSASASDEWVTNMVTSPLRRAASTAGYFSLP